MTTLTEKEHVADYGTDGMNSRELLRDVTIPDEVADAAWSTLKKYGALDLAPMLGVSQ